MNKNVLKKRKKDKQFLLYVENGSSTGCCPSKGGVKLCCPQ